MITCHTVQRITGLDFQNYLLLPQYSHSYLKSERHGFSTFKRASTKMKLGSLVDAIRTDGEVNMVDPLYPAAKIIASALKKEFGWALTRMHKQVSYTGIMQYHAGHDVVFQLPVKGRPDFEEPKTFIIDLKVTDEVDVDRVIQFLGYPNQQFGYGKLSGCPVAYLLFYRKKKMDTVLRKIQIGDTNRFWQEKIIKFGKAV